ncbi:MAG: AtpZ/AtpI family protein [Gemmatimonas sp.]
MDERKPPSLEDLDARLRAAQDRVDSRTGGGKRSGGQPMSGLGLAFRVGIELVSALAVGVGIGWFLDRWLGTKPWLMVVFFFLGAAAGVLNVWRAVSGIGAGPGYRPVVEKDEETDGR